MGMINEQTKCPEGVPEHLWGGMKNYVLYGRVTGSYLEALFSNDLFEVFARGDEKAIDGLEACVRYIVNHCPIGCHGSAEHVQGWREAGGLVNL